MEKITLQINVFAVFYNGAIASPFLSLVGNFLSEDVQINSDSIINTIDIYAHIETDKPPRQDLKLLSERFEKRIKNLPLCWLKRKKKLFEIAYYSQICTSEELKEIKTSKSRLQIFREMCSEIILTTELIKTRVKTNGNFDCDYFDLHLKSRLTQIPTTEIELDTLLNKNKRN